MSNWILPENIADVLPPEARRVEALRRDLLDLYASYGYDLVLPPLVEFVESLLATEDAALDLKTFKFVDQFSGRQMGLRADITPQVARIDAHLLNQPGVTRLCYAGSTVNTLPDGILSTRQPLQVGAEIYGSSSLEADIEAVELLLASLRLAGIEQIHLDLGHFALFNALVAAAAIPAANWQAWFSAVQRKDLPGLRQLTATLPASLAAGFLALPTLYGSVDVLSRARSSLPDLPAIAAALSELEQLEAALLQRGIRVAFDLAEVRSAYYHTGLMYSAYADGWSNAIARGGRYDHVGAKFGRARPATGFSLDLKELSRRLPPAPCRQGILAPTGQDPALNAKIAALRAEGCRVVVDLAMTGDAAALRCDQKLQETATGWQLVPVT